MLNSLPSELSLMTLQLIPLNQLLSLRRVSSSWCEIVDKFFGHKFIHFIDDQRLAHGENNFKQTIEALCKEDFTINRVCIDKFDLLQDNLSFDGPMNIIMSNVWQLQISNCELSFKFLCFIVNRVKNLQILNLRVLFDKSIESKSFHLRPKVFSLLTELNISNCVGMEDKSFVKLSEEMHSLQILKCVQTKMVFYQNYIRRYYAQYNDIDSCWSRPTNFGFTFNIVRAMLKFVACPLKTIHLGPNISTDNVLQLINLDSLIDIYLMFPTKLEAETFEAKVRSLPNLNNSKHIFHFKEITTN